jgi:hypothetical protein
VDPEQRERVRKAVEEERERFVPKEIAPSKDEAGRELKAMLDMPTSVVNKLAALRRGRRQGARRVLGIGSIKMMMTGLGTMANCTSELGNLFLVFSEDQFERSKACNPALQCMQG